MDGGVRSEGITRKEQDVELPASSVAVRVMFVLPVITVPMAGF
jgi:hypothetical protein